MLNLIKIRHKFHSKRNFGTFQHNTSNKKDYITLIGARNAEIMREEEHFRSLFVKYPTVYEYIHKVTNEDIELKDPHLNMESLALTPFKKLLIVPDEQNIPKILRNKEIFAPLGSPSIEVGNIATMHLLNFGYGLLEYINWNNLLLAGGSVLSLILPNNGRNKFESTNLDFFLHGLEEYEALNKIYEIHDALQRKTEGNILTVRGKTSVTFITNLGPPHVQVHLKLFKSPAEVLIHMDIDCCAVGFDGKDVWAFPRAFRALTQRYNLVDFTKTSSTYEMRLFKYSKFGFAVGIPGFSHKKVDHRIYFKKFSEVQGLARLLLLNLMDRSRDYTQPKPLMDLVDISLLTSDFQDIETEVENGKSEDDTLSAFIPSTLSQSQAFSLLARRALASHKQKQHTSKTLVYENPFVFGFSVEKILTGLEGQRKKAKSHDDLQNMGLLGRLFHRKEKPKETVAPEVDAVCTSLPTNVQFIVKPTAPIQLPAEEMWFKDAFMEEDENN